MTIVITGATGNLGRLVMQQLLYRVPASKIAVSVRNPGAAKSWGEQQMEVRYGDYDVPESLESSFRGASKLLLISSPHADDDVRLRQHMAAVDAAKRAGVSHIVYTSIVRPELGKLPLHRLHLETERAIASAGIPYTILRNAYYSDIVKLLGVREAVDCGELRSPPGQWTFNTAAREDLAAAAVTVLTEKGHENRTYELTAERAWGLSELAKVLSEVTGRRVVYRTDPAMTSIVYRTLPLADMKFVSPDLVWLAGKPLRSLTDEVRELFSPINKR
ncbi:NmrA family NAD(P)-binding protein [Paenibacillus sp. PR3]|uniref:NmrA family NAD(P)-binding protein n=1 Tax=Paenibacillus terricola TaxID=2763503 RepID=A0ABR8N3S7_9BACL|nr:NmrA family NAD(P)-binding protein [Paenibacillus terricola]MBD3922057.1 NmrA family NAD(P)-binding protein [Paenibacillus terricola]